MKGKGDTESDPGHSVELNYVKCFYHVWAIRIASGSI